MTDPRNHRGCSGCEEHPEPNTGQCRECLLEDRGDELEAVLRLMLQSATPHPTHHPTMWIAWRKAEDLLRVPRKRSHAIQTDKKRELELMGGDYERTAESNSEVRENGK